MATLTLSVNGEVFSTTEDISGDPAVLISGDGVTFTNDGATLEGTGTSNTFGDRDAAIKIEGINTQIFNSLSGSVSGQLDGISSAESATGLIIENASSITGFGGNGISLLGGGTILNLASGEILGRSQSIVFSNLPGSINNHGLIGFVDEINVSSQGGISFSEGGSVINQLTGQIVVEGNAIFGSLSGAPLNISNAGLIESIQGFAIQLAGGATITNSATGSILGVSNAILAFNVAINVENRGQIISSASNGISVDEGGVIQNLGAESLIAGDSSGALLRLGNFEVSNEGLISGATFNGILFQEASGSVTNAATGIIEGVEKSIVSFAPGNDDFIHIITNDGLINGMIDLGGGDDLITNNGTIIGDILLGAGNDEFVHNGSTVGNIDLGPGNDRVSIAAPFSGIINGGEFEQDVLVLSGSISGYQFDALGLERVTVTDIDLADGDLGTFELISIEVVEFDTETITFRPTPNEIGCDSSQPPDGSLISCGGTVVEGLQWLPANNVDLTLVAGANIGGPGVFLGGDNNSVTNIGDVLLSESIEGRNGQLTGIAVGTEGTVNNDGFVVVRSDTAVLKGVSAIDGLINNSGVIRVEGGRVFGALQGNNSVIVNDGIIDVIGITDAKGIFAGGNNTIINNGLIQVHNETLNAAKAVTVSGGNFIENNGSIRVTSDERVVGMFLIGFENRVVNNGLFEVEAGNDAIAIDMRSTEVINNGTIRVSAPDLAWAVRMQFGPQNFENHGLIHVEGGRATGLIAFFPRLSQSTITNSGEIVVIETTEGADSVGIHVGNDGFFGFVIDNGGSISADVAIKGEAAASPVIRLAPIFITNTGIITGNIDLTDSIDTIENTGTIIGDIFLNNGNDIFRNAGEITGAIDLGGGQDEFVGSIAGVNGQVSGLVLGGAGNDTLIGSNLSDNLSGGEGNDLLEGLAGNDILEGGAGSDTASYANSTASVRINLELGTNDGGDADGDSLTGIENLQGSGHADSLTGDDNVNQLAGLAGDDILEGGAGADVLDGGTGVDTARYDGSSTGVRVDLSTGTGGNGDAGSDVLIGIENLSGSDFSDTLIGDGSGNVLTGNDGNDELLGNVGNDILEGGAGADTLDGGAGSDTASYAGSAAGVTVKLWNGSASGGDAAGDTLTSIENLIGSDFSDTLVGDNGGNSLAGGDGNDRLFAGGGDDTLEGGAGADKLDGGAGSDAASYAGSAAAVTVKLWNASATGGDAVGDSFISIEDVIGSAFNDTLVGDDNDNSLKGGGGNDRLYGSNGNDSLGGDAGDDRLFGGAGNDILEGGSGGDLLDGGAGRDAASYAESSEAVTVKLWNGSGTGGDAVGDSFTSIENLIGSDFNDTFSGDNAKNALQGGDGNDRLFGGRGNDTLQGDTGADKLFGGEGIDTASYAGSSAGVTVKLWNGTGAGGDAEGDTLSEIENITGSSLADTLSGDSGVNRLEGGAGNDRLFGGSGDDILRGGAGNDRLFGQAGADVFVFDGTWGDDTVTDFEDGVELLDFSGSDLAFGDLTISQSGGDTLIEDAFGNSITLTGITATDIAADDFLF